MKLFLVQTLIVLLCYVQAIYTSEISEYGKFQDTDHVKKPIIPILKHNFEQHDEGYHYSYETGNGIHAEESGYIKHKGDKEHETLVQQGTITYHDEHGHPITLTYIADEHGFQPQGTHLPTPPPVPEEIQKAINYHSHTQDQEVEYGQQEDYEQIQNYAQPHY